MSPSKLKLITAFLWLAAVTVSISKWCKVQGEFGFKARGRVEHFIKFVWHSHDGSRAAIVTLLWTAFFVGAYLVCDALLRSRTAKAPQSRY